jgi:poly(3-hydroxybutyrate) depolymerase
MVFYWHGTLLSASAYALDTGPILTGVKAEGGVMVAFEGTTGGDLLSGTAIFGEGDLKLADQLVACAVANRNVDPHRIYATGCSAGGLFSAAMATMRSSYMAAAATNSGGWTIPLTFDSMNTPALMTVHGAPGVDVVAIDFSQSSATADMGFKTRGGFVVNCDTGGGHCGGAYLAGSMWDFFKAHPYGTKPSPWAGGLPSGFAKECKIF